MMRAWNSLNLRYRSILCRGQSVETEGCEACAYRSACFMEEWMVMAGKLQSFRSLVSSEARATLLTKMTHWLNSRASRRSTSLRFFSFSSSLT